MLALSRTAASDFKVDVYAGPTECDDEQRVSTGDSVSLHYVGSIDESSAAGERGKQFDSSRDDIGEPFEFLAGTRDVIPGWNKAIVGLCVGAKANLTVPPELATAAPESHTLTWPSVDEGATLAFDVEVVAVEKHDENLFEEVDTDGDGRISKEEARAFFDKMKAEHGGEFDDEEDAEPWEAFFHGEDVNADGHVSWEEFSGPKGQNPMGDEF